MKKFAFAFMFASLTSLVAAASHGDIIQPGDPKKQQDTQPTFTLSKGYFSLFNIFAIPVATPDTAKINPPVAPFQKEAVIKP